MWVRGGARVEGMRGGGGWGGMGMGRVEDEVQGGSEAEQGRRSKVWVKYLARFLGVRGVEGGGGHRVHLQESPHGPQEAFMP